MSKNVAVFVDVANLYYAARGQDVDVDYVALLKHATKGRDLIRAYAYSGLDPENENQRKFLDFLGKNGYRVVAKDIRKFGDGRVKANLDIELVVDLFRLADRMDVAVIVSGDGDFAPAIRALQDAGVRCEVISFRPNTSSDLFAVADEFVDAMKISAISRQKDTKGVGAPEMPAKEVNPEVGFREASPSVAAAALAAIRADGEGTGSTGRSRGRASSGTRTERPARSTRGGRARAASGEPVAGTEQLPAADGGEPPTPAAGGDDSASESARRRRRRGGRGRGRRGRRGDLPETAAAEGEAEPAEISWREVDSLEELDGLRADEGIGDDQEIGFAEADAATLAELGLTDQPGPTTAVEPTGAPEPTEAAVPATPKSRGRRSSTKAAPKPPASAQNEAGAPAAESGPKPAAKPRARSAKPAATAPKGGTPKAATPTAASESAAEPAAKPRAARTARSKSSPAAPASTDAPEEGIWQRFTSGRGTRKPATPEPPTEG